MRYFRAVFVTLLAIVLIAPVFAQEPAVVPRDQRPSLTEELWGLSLAQEQYRNDGATVWRYNGSCIMIKARHQLVQEVALVTAAMCQASATPNA
ncbi:MAG: hypothetical protein Q8O53_01785 [Candidatus Moranbacteria bacterium]|nr:hypothetical protein [Candidatus Moranbacteria bacterium]